MTPTEELKSDLHGVQDSPSNWAHKGRQALHQSRQAAAGAMHRAASALEDAAGRADLNAGRQAAHKLHQAAGYIEHHGAAELKDDAGRYIRSHPRGMMIAAAIAGFIFGRMIVPNGRRS